MEDYNNSNSVILQSSFKRLNVNICKNHLGLRRVHKYYSVLSQLDPLLIEECLFHELLYCGDNTLSFGGVYITSLLGIMPSFYFINRVLIDLPIP